MTQGGATTTGALVGGALGTVAGPLGTVAGAAVGGYIGNKLYDLREDERQAIEKLKDTHYADYNQAYYEELQKRASMGMPEESRIYAEQQANRAAGIGLQATEDQRAGLMGIGRTQTSLSDSYRNIATMDANQRLQNQMALLGEMGNRGQMSYQEALSGGQMDLALAGRNRQEFMSLLNSGAQTGANLLGMAPMAVGAPPVPLGQAVPQVAPAAPIQYNTQSTMGPPQYDPAQYNQVPAPNYTPTSFVTY